jgi:hypothetical protein
MPASDRQAQHADAPGVGADLVANVDHWSLAFASAAATFSSRGSLPQHGSVGCNRNVHMGSLSLLPYSRMYGPVIGRSHQSHT